jgi:ABC-type sulfate transport system substrate-binding protein
VSDSPAAALLRRSVRAHVVFPEAWNVSHDVSKELHTGLNASRVDYLIHRHQGSGVKQCGAGLTATIQ